MRGLLIAVFLLLTFSVFAQSDADKLKQGLELLEKGNFTESNELLIPLYSKNYMKDLVCYNISVNYFNLKNFVKAEKYAGESVEMNTAYSMQAAVIKGKCLSISGKVQEEEKFYLKMSEKYPKEFLFHNLLADNLLRQKKYDRAGEELKKSILLDKFGAAAHYKLGKIEEQNENLSKSLLCYYYFLMCSKDSRQLAEIISSISKIMNFNEIDRVISEKTSNENIALEEINMSSLMFFLTDLEKFSLKDSLPNLQKFVKNSISFLTNVSVMGLTHRKTGFFYEDFYVDFYAKLMENNMLDTFLYYCLIKIYPNVSEEIKGVTKEKMLEFAKVLEEN
ncbi:MAG: hypothetical protein II956_06195 [Bacteroidales bacterium]|nr:hypothetical protein [Bacteroidales bacterium]